MVPEKWQPSEACPFWIGQINAILDRIQFIHDNVNIVNANKYESFKYYFVFEVTSWPPDFASIIVDCFHTLESG